MTGDLTDILADELMDGQDFPAAVEKARRAFSIYQQSLQPTQQEMMDVLENAAPQYRAGVEALKEVVGFLEYLNDFQETAVRRYKEAREDEPAFMSDMAGALTVAMNASNPTIVAHTLNNSNADMLDEIVSQLSPEVRAYLGIPSEDAE